MRKEIKEFAEEMEIVMQKHDARKGDSWKRMDLCYLNKLFQEEIVEYQKAERADVSRDELIDIANIAMMIWANLSVIIGDKQLSRRREKEAKKDG